MSTTSLTAVLPGAEWVLRTVGGPGGQGVVHGAQCTTCRESSGLGVDAVRSVGAWAIAHTRAHPEHRTYVCTARTRWQVDPRTDPPPSSAIPAETEAEAGTDHVDPVDAGGDLPARHPVHHARPRPATHFPGALSLRHALGQVRCRIAQYAGPLFLAAVSGALGFVLCAALVQEATGHG